MKDEKPPSEILADASPEFREYMKEVQEDAAEPEGKAGFFLVPHRYILGIWSVKVPKEMCTAEPGSSGGDITMQVFRKHEEPTRWAVTYRWRYYFEETAFGDKDRKSWFVGEAMRGTEEDILGRTRAFFAALKGVAARLGLPMEDACEYLLQCDGGTATQRIVSNPPPFMHTAIATDLDREGYFKNKVVGTSHNE